MGRYDRRKAGALAAREASAKHLAAQSRRDGADFPAQGPSKKQTSPTGLFSAGNIAGNIHVLSSDPVETITETGLVISFDTPRAAPMGLGVATPLRVSGESATRRLLDMVGAANQK